mgnify:CR=1 FL=1
MDFKILLEPHILAVVISLLATWGATELVKRVVRRYLQGDQHDLIPPLLGFIIGTIIGTYSWPRDTEVEPIIFGVAIGLAAPLLYSLVIMFIRRRWPVLANRVTGSRPTVQSEKHTWSEP